MNSPPIEKKQADVQLLEDTYPPIYPACDNTVSNLQRQGSMKQIQPKRLLELENFVSPGPCDYDSTFNDLA